MVDLMIGRVEAQLAGKDPGSTRYWVPGRCAGPSSARSRTSCRRRSCSARCSPARSSWSTPKASTPTPNPPRTPGRSHRPMTRRSSPSAVTAKTPSSSPPRPGRASVCGRWMRSAVALPRYGSSAPATTPARQLGSRAAIQQLKPAGTAPLYDIKQPGRPARSAGQVHDAGHESGGRRAVAAVNAVSSTPAASAPSSRAGSSISGRPCSRTAAMIVPQPIPNSRATAEAHTLQRGEVLCAPGHETQDRGCAGAPERRGWSCRRHTRRAAAQRVLDQEPGDQDRCATRPAGSNQTTLVPR